MLLFYYIQNQQKKHTSLPSNFLMKNYSTSRILHSKQTLSLFLSIHYKNVQSNLLQTEQLPFNRLFAAKPSRDQLFIKLWVATLRMLEMEKGCQKHQNGQV